jgi:outer membrane immunogenic protein
MEDFMRTAFCAAALAMLTIPMASMAADLRVRPQPAPVPVYVPPPFSWTGFYIGGNVGGAWADGNVTNNFFGLNASTSRSGFVGGGQLGFNYQFSNIVLGAEWDLDWTSLNATGNGVFIPAVGTLQAVADTRWVSTLAARFGVALDYVLLYGKAGAGWVENNATINNLTTGASVSASNTVSGWMIGAGIEWAFTPSWSAKLEYDFLGLQSWTFAGLPRNTFTVNRDIQMLKVGLNYRLPWDAWTNYWLRCGPGCL